MLQRIRVVTVVLAMGAGALALTSPASAEVQAAAPEISNVELEPGIPDRGLRQGRRGDVHVLRQGRDAAPSSSSRRPARRRLTPGEGRCRTEARRWTRWTATKSFDAASAGTWNFLALAKGDGEASARAPSRSRRRSRHQDRRIRRQPRPRRRGRQRQGLRPARGRRQGLRRAEGHASPSAAGAPTPSGTSPDVTSGGNGWFAAQVRAGATGWWRAEFAATSAAGARSATPTGRRQGQETVTAVSSTSTPAPSPSTRATG